MKFIIHLVKEQVFFGFALKLSTVPQSHQFLEVFLVNWQSDWLLYNLSAYKYHHGIFL